jgi:uncharacterized protein
VRRIFLLASVISLLVIFACGDGDDEPPAETPEPEQTEAPDGDTGGRRTRAPTDPQVGGILDDLAEQRVQLANDEEDAPRSRLAFEEFSLPTVTDYLNLVIQNNDQTWTEYFFSIGLQEPFVSYRIVQPGEAYTSACQIQGQSLAIAHDTPNAYYCPLDELDAGYVGAIWLPLTTFTNMWTGYIFQQRSAEQGDFGAAIVTAHEFGHHVADELWFQFRQNDGVDYRLPNLPEHIADCFAGVWAANVYYQGYLRDDDFPEAVEALFAIGDNNPDSPHGTPQERADALRLGYLGSSEWPPGSPGACIQAYW